jgi:hypothetical protein
MKKTIALFVALAVLFAGTALTHPAVHVDAKPICVTPTAPPSSTSFAVTNPCISSSSVAPACDSSDDDGRLDPVCEYQAQTVAVYCDIPNEGDLTLFLVVKGKGVADFSVPAATLEAAMDQTLSEPLVIAKKLGITLSYLPSGEFQVNGPVGADGKVFVFRWESC